MTVVTPPPQDELELLIREARARQRRRRVVAGVGAVAVVTGTVLAARSLADVRPQPASPPRSSVAAGAHDCRGGQLAISFVRKGAVMGQAGGLLRFTNTSGVSCRISGWPRVIAVTRSERKARASRSLQSMLFATFWQHIRPVPRLTLAQGVSGYAVLGGVDNPAAAGRESSAWQCPTARRLLVSPPGSRRRVTLSGFLYPSGPNQIYLPLCGGRLWVEPIRPRPHFYN